MKSILETMTDERLFASTFRRRGLLGKDTFKNWKIFLACLFGLPLSDEDRVIAQKFTGRTDFCGKAFTEAFLIAGRRSGKSLISALVAVFLAAFKNYDDVLVAGEVGTLMVIASDRKQASVILKYIQAFFRCPLLKSMVISELKESLTIKNGAATISIEVVTCSFRATRGYSLIGCVCDELAWWATDETSSNPDSETLAAVRPGLATTGGLLLCVSSPYSKKGALYEAYRDFYGKVSDVLIWRGSSRELNPTLSAAVVAMALLRDRAAAMSEYLAEFRSDISGFIDAEIVESCTIRNRFELPFNSEQSYVGFVDPSGGKSDSMTLGIAHAEENKAVLDLLREATPPFSPESVVAEFADTLASYGISTVVGDRYAGSWPSEQFAKRGIRYETSERTKSEIFLETLPLLMSGQCELLDNRKLLNQFSALERRTARGGRDSVDHMPGSHDDLCNAAAGALVLLHTNTREHGYIAYLKCLAAGIFEMPPDPKVEPQADNPRRELVGKLEQLRFEQEFRALRPVTPDVWVDKFPPCPACASVCVIKLGSGSNGNTLHCNSCAANFTSDGVIEVAPPSSGACCSSPAPQSIPGGMRCANCGRSISASRADVRPRGSFGRV
jgi:hypothetical protein